MAGRWAAARRGKDGRAADPPAGCAGRSWFRRQRGRSNESEAHVTAVIEVTGLTKRYGGLAVVDDIAFHVDAGEIFGILGPNGAGKTTAVECMTALPGVISASRRGNQVDVTGTGDFASAVTAELARRQVLVADLRIEGRSLDSAYVALTGRSMES
jgi:ABC-type cobalamin/Fe3+-siderophores transport system ATPase subunit